MPPHRFKKGNIPWNNGIAMGIYKSRFYTCWINMKQRCSNPKYRDFHRYGGRGITVCEKWLQFKGFYEDMYSTYRDNLTIERIDNNKGYSRENCKWIPAIEQAINRRYSETAQKHEYNGQSFTIGQWAYKIGINRKTLNTRINALKWPLEKALTLPVSSK